MKNRVLIFFVIALFVAGVPGVFVSAADAADAPGDVDSTYWINRIASIEGSGLSKNEKEFKIKLIRKYMGESSKNQVLPNLASLY